MPRNGVAEKNEPGLKKENVSIGKNLDIETLTKQAAQSKLLLENIEKTNLNIAAEIQKFKNLQEELKTEEENSKKSGNYSHIDYFNPKGNSTCRKNKAAPKITLESFIGHELSSELSTNDASIRTVERVEFDHTNDFKRHFPSPNFSHATRN